MEGELFINGFDAFATWGLSLGYGAIATLFKPSAAKEYIKNETRSEHGSRVVGTLRYNERELNLQMFISAPDRISFIGRMEAFMEHIESTEGVLNITTRYQEGTTYKCRYLDWASFSEFNGRMGKFLLKIVEPNPKDRT